MIPSSSIIVASFDLDEIEAAFWVDACTVCQQVFRTPLTNAGRGDAERIPSATSLFFSLLPALFGLREGLKNRVGGTKLSETRLSLLRAKPRAKGANDDFSDTLSARKLCQEEASRALSKDFLEGPFPAEQGGLRFLSSRCQRLGRGTPGRGWEGVLPSQESFFQPFPCPVK